MSELTLTNRKILVDQLDHFKRTVEDIKKAAEQRQLQEKAVLIKYSEVIQALENALEDEKKAESNIIQSK